MDISCLKGSIPALVTPFGEDCRVDQAALGKLVDWQIEQGSTALVAVGTTGESPTLSHHEHKMVVELVIRQARNKVPVIAGAGSNNTIETIDFILHAKAAGADAALLIAPYYNKPTQEGLFLHFHRICQVCPDLPVVLYNVPGRTVTDISVQTTNRLYREIDNIIGLKDATSDLGRASALRKLCGEEFLLLSGEDMTALGFNAHGGQGCISVTANVAPRLCADLQQACRDNDYQRALQCQDTLFALHQALFVETSPAPVKYALSRLGICREDVRLPLAPLSTKARQQVDAAMQAAGIAR